MDAKNQIATGGTSGPCVLQVLPALGSGGAERTAVDIAHALEAAGWRSLVASEGGALEGLLPKSTRHVRLPLDSKNPLTILRNAGRLADLIASAGVDIVHARSRAPAWSALLAARRRRVKFVTTYHGAYSEPNRVKALYNSVMARADTVIANSQWTAALVADRYPFAAGRIVPIARGTDFSRFDPDGVSADAVGAQRDAWGAGADDFVVLHLARMGSWKGQAVVVERTLVRVDKGE